MDPKIIGLVIIAACSGIFTILIVVLALRYILYSDRPRRQSRLLFTGTANEPDDGNAIPGHWSHTAHHSTSAHHHSHGHDSGGSHSHGGSDGGGHSGGGDSGGSGGDGCGGGH